MAKKESAWAGFPEVCQGMGQQSLWRTHSDAVNNALLTRWWPKGQFENLLKTDLFDEAVSDGLSPLLNTRAKRVFYIDASFEVHQMAKRRHPPLRTIGADVRYLPFANDTFDGIVSNSTLDHFESPDDLVASLKELYRVLQPGAQMILTLDNLANPVIFLRNGLPFRLLQQLKIVPFYVGVTLGPHRLQHLLEEIGFKVLEVDAIMHCPRVLAVAVARWIQKYSKLKIQEHYLRFLQDFECLSHLPTRFFTGYFVAVRVIRP